jgi:hypothetical protein
MSKIFGGSKSRSFNTNRDAVTSAFSPLFGQATTAGNQLQSFLGGDTSGFDRFADAAGFDFELGRGMDTLNSNFGGRGTFNSGARDKALLEFGQGLKGRFADQYMRSLLGQSEMGLNAGNLVANVGQENRSSSSPGLGGLIGGVASGAAALKTGGASKKLGLGR